MSDSNTLICRRCGRPNHLCECAPAQPPAEPLRIVIEYDPVSGGMRWFDSPGIPIEKACVVLDLLKDIYLGRQKQAIMAAVQQANARRVVMPDGTLPRP